MIEPVSIFSIPIQEGRRLLSNSVTWQKECGASDAAGAIINTHFEMVDEPEGTKKNKKNLWQKMFPMCIVQNTLPAALSSIANATSAFENSGRIYMSFWFGVKGGQSKQDVRIDFLNKIGLIIEEMQALLVATVPGDYLHIRAWTIFQGPERANDDEIPAFGDFSFVSLECEFGT